MVVVKMLASIVVLVVVLKVLVWAAANVKMVVVVEVLVIDVLAGVEVGVILDVLTGISIEVLADVSVNAFAVAMTALEFPVLTPLVSRWAAFDCR